MKLLLTICVLSMSYLFNAQDSNAVKYANTINVENLKIHLNKLASDQLEGREAGRLGQRLASKYIANMFESFGVSKIMDSTYFQRFEFYESKLSNASLTNGKDTLLLNDGIFMIPRYGAPESMQLKSHIYLPFDSLKTLSDSAIIGSRLLSFIKKRALVNGSEDIRRTFKKFIRAGAESLILCIDSIEGLKDYFIDQSKHSIVSLKKKQLKTKNCLAFICELNAFEKISGSKIRPLANDSIHMDLYFKKTSSSRIFFTENVLGVVEFDKRSDEYVVLSAHYDHLGKKNGVVYNGADDDGSGTASIMLIAEALAKAKKDNIKLKRNFLFIGFSAEEKGLLGSRYYTDNPMIPLEHIIAGLNIDMIARADTLKHKSDDYLYIIGSDMIDQDLHDINEITNKAYSSLELDYRFNNTEDPNQFYYRSDHYNFAKNNIPVIFYFRGVHEDYHKPTDTIDKILWDKLEKFSKHIFYTAWEIGKRPSMLTR